MKESQFLAVMGMLSFVLSNTESVDSARRMWNLLGFASLLLSVGWRLLGQ